MQAVPAAPDGHPALYTSPIAELAGDLPLVPLLMAGLIPQSINVWMGAARDGGWVDGSCRCVDGGAAGRA